MKWIKKLIAVLKDEKHEYHYRRFGSVGYIPPPIIKMGNQ